MNKCLGAVTCPRSLVGSSTPPGCLGPSRLVRRGTVSLAPRNLEAGREGRGGDKSVWFVCLVHRTFRAWSWGETGLISDQLSCKEWLFALYNGVSYANHITRGLIVSGGSALQTCPGVAVSNCLQTVCPSKKSPCHCQDLCLIAHKTASGPQGTWEPGEQNS